MRMGRQGGFANKWVPKVLLSPVRIRIYGPKTAILPQNMHIRANIGPVVSFGALLVGMSVCHEKSTLPPGSNL